jgi:hypothetical protein
MKAIAETPRKALSRVRTGSFVRAADLPGSRVAAHSVLSRAHSAGELVAIRKGLYWKGERTRYGMTRPSTEEVAVNVLGKQGVGPTGFTAARALGLTTQLPAKPAMTVAGPVPSSVPGVLVSKRNNMARRRLRFVEIAVLELLRGDWERTVDDGWPALVDAVRRETADRRIRLDRLAEAVESERSPAARESFARLADSLSH